MTWVQDNACRLLPIEERCIHIEGLRTTCSFNKSTMQCQSSLYVHGSRGSAELSFASASRTRSRVAVSSIQDGGMLMSIL